MRAEEQPEVGATGIAQRVANTANADQLLPIDALSLAFLLFFFYAVFMAPVVHTAVLAFNLK